MVIVSSFEVRFGEKVPFTACEKHSDITLLYIVTAKPGVYELKHKH